MEDSSGCCGSQLGPVMTVASPSGPGIMTNETKQGADPSVRFGSSLPCWEERCVIPLQAMEQGVVIWACAVDSDARVPSREFSSLLLLAS
ncbi:hypothetical protein VTK73DRAFT_4578 [Phialemonium thermophilum]|uniref:Uncharacterized protein n=1 Tax=Phialemonium thermophilum TaxID=223376 RepID=A0ABR3V7I0_9PEZI